MAEVWISAQRAADMLGMSRRHLHRAYGGYGFRTRKGSQGRLEFLLKEVVDSGGSTESAMARQAFRAQQRVERARKRLEDEIDARIQRRSAATRPKRVGRGSR